MTTASPLSVSPGRLALGRANAAAALLLLLAGGMVTSTASGLAVPDWPLSYGQWLPAMVGGVLFEHGHRMVATAVGVLILVMTFWTQAEERRPGVRRLAWWTLLATCLQGFLGGVTVWFGLPVAVSAAHATLGQTVFCLLVIMADLLSGGAERAEKPAGSLRWVAALAAFALWFQLVLGSVLRHGGAGLRWHLLGAIVSIMAAGWLGMAAVLERQEPRLRRPALALLVLLGVQLILGAAAAGGRLLPDPRTNAVMIAAATVHLAVGALLLGTATLLAFRLFRLEAK